MAAPTDQWQQLYRVMSPHLQFFHELHRRLQRIGLQSDHRYLMALDRACQALGTVAIFTHYQMCRRDGQIDEDAGGPAECWMGEGI